MSVKRSVDEFCVVALEYRSKVTVPVGIKPVTVAWSAIEAPTTADAGCWVVPMTSATVASGQGREESGTGEHSNHRTAGPQPAAPTSDSLHFSPRLLGAALL